MPRAQCNPTTDNISAQPSAHQVSHEGQPQLRSDTQLPPQNPALLPTLSSGSIEHGNTAAGLTIGTITNAYFTTGPDSRPGSAWNAAPFSSTHSLAQAPPAAADAASTHAANAAPRSLLINPFPGISHPATGTADPGGIWPVHPDTVNLWQQPSFAPGAEPSSPLGPSASFGAFADSSPAQDFASLGMLGSKRSNSSAATGDDVVPTQPGIAAGVLLNERLLSSAGSSASSKRHKSAHMSPTSAKYDAHAPSQVPLQSFAAAQDVDISHHGSRVTNQARPGSDDAQQPADVSHTKHMSKSVRAGEEARQEKPARRSRAAWKSPPRYHFDRSAHAPCSQLPDIFDETVYHSSQI